MHLTLMCQQLQVVAVSTSLNTSSKLKSNTGIIESVVSVNFKVCKCSIYYNIRLSWQRFEGAGMARSWQIQATSV